jgi:hypothetical protein
MIALFATSSLASVSPDRRGFQRRQTVENGTGASTSHGDLDLVRPVCPAPRDHRLEQQFIGERRTGAIPHLHCPRGVFLRLRAGDERA